MSDEIYVNTGTTIQQPFNDRQPSNAQQPYIANAQQPYIANSQTPFTYSNRNPALYRNPTNNQTPYIANAQQPYPYIANARQPYIANGQQPYPYIANAQNPYQASAQQPYPFTYTANSQTPYIANSQAPFTYQNRQPSSSQTPYIANSQTPFTYQARATPDAQQPSNGQTPFTYDNRQPAIYQHPFTYNSSTPAVGTTPVTYDVFGGGSSSTANIETTSDFGPSNAPFMTVSNTTVGMSSNEWWGSNSPHMTTNPNSAFAPGNPNYPANPLASGFGNAYQWQTTQIQNFSYSHGQCFAQFILGYSTTQNAVYYQYAGGNSTAYANYYGWSPYYIYLPLTEINNNNIIDSTWNIDIKYTVQSQTASVGTSDTKTPASVSGSSARTAGTYYSIWNTSSSNSIQFMWMAASSSNYNQQTGSTTANGLIFTIRASKTGQTTYYTHFICSNSGAINGHISEIYLRSTYGSQQGIR